MFSNCSPHERMFDFTARQESCYIWIFPCVLSRNILQLLKSSTLYSNWQEWIQIQFMEKGQLKFIFSEKRRQHYFFHDNKGTWFNQNCFLNCVYSIDGFLPFGNYQSSAITTRVIKPICWTSVLYVLVVT